MSPKSPTTNKEDTEGRDTIQCESVKSKEDRPTSLTKRDIVVEISGNEKTTVKTVEEFHEKSNMCKVHDNYKKGRNTF